MMPGMGAPEMAPVEPSIDQLAAFEQLREQVSPTEFNSEMLSAAEQADPVAVAEFKRELAALEVAPEVIDMLNAMVDEVLANPGDYPAIRQKYMAMGVDEELLPEVFDAGLFAALNMALDELRGPGTMAPPQGFARGGIASLKPMAREMAAAGRYGDTMLAHISPVEAQILRRYGGSGTINPRTGAPEFFLKKMFKSIGRAVKKFASSTVGKLVTTVALGFFLGPAAAGLIGATAPAAVAAVSGFVGSAGSTLLAGGNAKDALKAGAIGGLTAGATTAVFKGADAFKSVPKAGTAAPATAGTTEAALPALEQPVAATTAPATTAPATTAPANLTRSPLDFTVDMGTRTAAPAPLPAQAAMAMAPVTPPAGTVNLDALGGRVPASTAANYLGQPAQQGFTVGATPEPSLMSRAINAISPKAILEDNPDAGLLRQYGPLAATGLGIMALTGGFEEQPSEIPPGFEGMVGGQGTTGVELLAKYPERYGISLGPVQTISSAPYTSANRLYSAGAPQYVAKGGIMALDQYPRKNGHIAGPGTGTSDDIPAMLSDGEFVFTAKAVRAMGDGSRRKGAKRMYALMRKLEGRANG
jgi:hypothetical protein